MIYLSDVCVIRLSRVLSGFSIDPVVNNAVVPDHTSNPNYALKIYIPPFFRPLHNVCYHDNISRLRCIAPTVMRDCTTYQRSREMQTTDRFSCYGGIPPHVILLDRFADREL